MPIKNTSTKIVYLCLLMVPFFLACADNSAVMNILDGDVGSVDGDIDDPEGDLDGDAEGGLADGDDEGTLPDGDVVVDGDEELPQEIDGDEVYTDGDDIEPDGDEDFIWRCSVHLDCPFGFACEEDAPGDGCVMRAECYYNEDCPENYYCQEVENWNECREMALPDECAEDGDCPYGSACQADETGRMVCVDANECINDADCGEDRVCVDGTQWDICQDDPHECNAHTDCLFDYRCTLDDFPHVCEYASTCTGVGEGDCDFGYSCKKVENWRECVLGFATCLNDEACPPDEYCRWGTCTSRDECQLDSDCQEEGFVCASNGVYNVCAMGEDECEVDSDCEFGYSCHVGDPRNYCEYANECNVDSECGANEICVPGEQWKVCQNPNFECSDHSDCLFGYMCNMDVNPHICSYASTCSSDADCSAFETCQVIEGNWKECQIDWSPGFCTSDDDCEAHEFCDIIAGFGTCKSRNECTDDMECEQDYVCESNGVYNECVWGVSCQEHTDCPIGYRCVEASPRNECEYANECTQDSDCSSIQECRIVDNWAECQLAWNGVCVDDTGCAEDEYCDGVIGGLGTCRSKDQCFVDEDCLDENLVCEDNGEFNECVPGHETACWFDIQCPEGWRCIDGACHPLYEGMCSEVEGRWTVWYSPIGQLACALIPIGTVYEFIPEDGCNGGVKREGGTIDLGTFSELGNHEYDVTFTLIYQCTAKVIGGTLMSMDCPGCTGIQLSSL